jgi:hypothetical protein
LIADANRRAERNLFLFGVDDVGGNEIDVEIGSNGIFLGIISNIAIMQMIGFKGQCGVGKNNVIAKKMGGKCIVATWLSEWKIECGIGPCAIANGIG